MIYKTTMVETAGTWPTKLQATMAFSPWRAYILYALPDHFSLHRTMKQGGLGHKHLLTSKPSFQFHVDICQPRDLYKGIVLVSPWLMHKRQTPEFGLQKNAPLFFILHSNNNGFIPTGQRSRTRSPALQFSISDRADEALAGDTVTNVMLDRQFLSLVTYFSVHAPQQY